MDSYTVVVWAEPSDDGRHPLRPRVAGVLQELRAADSGAAGRAFVALASAAGGRCLDWRRLEDVVDAADLELPSGGGGSGGDVCAVLDGLADRLPDRDVPVNVVWLYGARAPAAGTGGLLAALLRWRLWHGALLQLRPTGGGAAQLATWRRLLDADEAAPLRPALRAQLWVPAGPPSTAVRLQAACDAASWELLTGAAAAAHGLAAGERHQVSLALLDGAEVVAEVTADSALAAALTDCTLRVRQLGAAGGRPRWGAGCTALLVRLLVAPPGDGERRRATDDWRRLAADGRPPDRRPPPPNSRLLHFVITAGDDGSSDGLMTLLSPGAAKELRHRPAELSLAELQALADAQGWAAATELVTRLAGAEEPSCCPERRGLAHWQDVHRRGAPAAGRPAADSLVLDADGILGALAGMAARGKLTEAAPADTNWLEQLVKLKWPKVAEQRAHGVYYNTSAAAEGRELRAAQLKERCVVAETACTCSVWRSDAVSVNTAAVWPPSRSSPRRRAAAGAERPTKPDRGPAAARPRTADFRQRLGKAVQAALAERGVTGRDALFRGCARKLATIVRAYLEDVKVAGGASARQMLQEARVHVRHVIKVQRDQLLADV